MTTRTDLLLPGGEPIQGLLEYPLARGKLLIGLQGKPPAWVEPTLRSLDRLLHLPPSWDSYAGRPIAHSSVWATLHLLTEILPDDAGALVSTARGGVQIEWHRNGVDLEIEILSPHRYLAAFEDTKTGESWERELTEDLSPLVPYVARLSGPAEK